jgi:hypothetical protein
MGNFMPIYGMAGNATQWLLGGALGKINNHTGNVSSTTFSDISNLMSAFGLDDIYAQSYGYSNGIWLFGGANAHLNKWDGTSFTDISGLLTGFASTDAIKTIGYNGSVWLIGGANGHLNSYDGTTCTDLTSALATAWGSGGINVNAVAWDGSEWYIGGDAAHLASYDGSTFTNISSNLVDFSPGGTPQPVLSLCYNGNWFIGGGNGCLNWSSFYGWLDMRDTLSAYWIGYYNINSITTDGNIFYFGGDAGHVGSFDPMTISWVDYSGIVSSIFGSNNILSTCWNSNQGTLFIGAQNAELASLILPATAINLSSSLINFGSSSLTNITSGLDNIFIAGTSAHLNRYGPTYSGSASALSTIVATTPQSSFYSVTMTVSDNLPAGTVINYWLTANGQLGDPGSYWIQERPAHPRLLPAFSAVRI